MGLTPEDRRILRALRKNGRLSNVKLAKETNISESACLRRTRHLEQTGVIRKYEAKLNAAKLGYKVSAYVIVQLDQRTEVDARRFIEAVSKEERVVEAAVVTGGPDVILKVIAKDMEDFADLTMRSLMTNKSVRDISSSLILEQIKSDAGPPV
ncbi:MAG: Lrp/AsnC family transcriptional regulator [Pseudomonadota bacterium]